MKIQHPACVHVSPTISGHYPRLAYVSLVRWRSDDRNVSKRHQVSPRSNPLTRYFKHVRWWIIAWTRVHAIDASRLDPTPTARPRCLHKLNSAGHSPTRNKRRRIVTIKDRRAVRICVTAPIYLPGPTNPWALHLPTPLPHGAPHGRPRGPVDPRGLLPRVYALCATCASRGPPAALPRGLSAALHPRGGPACHISLLAGPACHVSSCGKLTPFLRF